MEFYRFLCFLFCLYGQLLLNLPFSIAQLCRPVQSDALLQFNDSLTVEIDTDSDCDPKMTTWKNGLDCCSWDGVTCDNVTGTLRSNSSLCALCHLQSLNLAFNNFRTSPILLELSVFPELRHLNLSHSNFSGLVPIEISFLSKLVLIDLSWNYKNGVIFAEKSLKIENTGFKILVQNLTKLRELNLDFIDMSAVSLDELPPNIFSLPNLLDLNLEFNDFMVSFLKSNWSKSLESLTLSFISILGKIPDSISEFQNLKTLYLSKYILTGSIPSSLVNLTKLTSFDLSHNELTGHIPSFFVKLEQLMDVDLSFNNFTGLNLMYNSMNHTFPKLETLALPSCNLTEFPPFLNSLKMLRELDLSENKIGNQIPRWFWDVVKGTLQSLDIYSNLIEGGIQQFPWKELIDVDLRDNLFQGPLPKIVHHDLLNISHNKINDTSKVLLESPSLEVIALQFNEIHGQINPPTIPFHPSGLHYFSISNNNLGGQWPKEYFLCLLNLRTVDLSNNIFEGPLLIPPPTTGFYFSANNKIGGKVSPLICNATELVVLDLSNNRCHMIPKKFAEDSKLRTIDFSRNRFEGTLPPSLLRCENLEVLDLGNNRIEDMFLDWLGTLPKLQVLILRSNVFHGFVRSPREAHSFFELRIFDLFNNNLSGPLPIRYIMNIDLSSNHFGGELPLDIGNLKSLKGLNFSHNNLTGYIPPSTGNLTELEWLDLSSNKFTGRIPRELADLTSLAFLNLSENQLIGPIPQGRQFNTFKSDLFAENPRLCGFPLLETCTNSS
ncbi:hypothetical protein EUGRSUZ_F00517 [Eucalyptus grandis]|uniref:Uncharacterized protein n=2 Tax=Eucalyptus grandis TaxID=71139 RepID=A0ACC3KBE7_EUCGR|nr:hypothetical protein EUGRSUZ_F00517 [Eucalyptus grandis]